MSAVADAILGIDTLWGGDVMNPSGTGRFIADSWFSDEPLPPAYTHPTAARLRETGGVSAKQPDLAAIDAYLAAVDVRGAIAALADEAKTGGRIRRAYLKGLALCFEVMWDLAMEMLGRGEKVPYERCVVASTGRAARALRSRRRSGAGWRSCWRAPGIATDSDEALLAAVDAWRRDRGVPKPSIPALGAAFIARYDALAVRHLLPYLPAALRAVPRANITFLPIKDAWFSGSMNYLGRARRRDGTPEYEATYEINASLEISVPEFEQLVSHEVVPGHVTTSAYCQNLYVRGKMGFEATVLTMNTRHAALSEGIANNAILIAHGVTEIDQLPDEDMQIGVLLALLQDDAKNQSSYLTWHEGLAAAGGGAGAAARVPLLARARRQAVGRVGPASAARPDVPAGLPRGHGARGRAAAPLPAGGGPAGAVRRARPGGRRDHRESPRETRKRVTR